MAPWYGVLKEHFDKLFVGGYTGTGYETIRTTYEKMFDEQINLFDVYQTDLRIAHNPITSMITLVGSDPEGRLSEGIMMSRGNIVCVSIIEDEYLKGFENDNDAALYMGIIYKYMRNIVEMDRFHAADSIARNNPYMVLLKCCPLYYAFHHFKDCFSGQNIPFDTIKSLLEKYITSDEDNISKIIDSLTSSKYSVDPEIVYKTMTCGGKLILLD